MSQFAREGYYWFRSEKELSWVPVYVSHIDEGAVCCVNPDRIMDALRIYDSDKRPRWLKEVAVGVDAISENLPEAEWGDFIPSPNQAGATTAI